MDHQQGSLLWNESDVDSLSSLIATMGRRVWRVENGKDCWLFLGFHKVNLSFSGRLISCLLQF